MKKLILAAATTLLFVSGTASANPCTDQLKKCLDENRAWYEGCVDRARALANDPRAGADFGELRALCAQTRQSFDQICRDTATECSKKRVNELKELSGE